MGNVIDIMPLIDSRRAKAPDDVAKFRDRVRDQLRQMAEQNRVEGYSLAQHHANLITETFVRLDQVPEPWMRQDSIDPSDPNWAEKLNELVREVAIDAAARTREACAHEFFEVFPYLCLPIPIDKR
jgi:hypothetical protein